MVIIYEWPKLCDPILNVGLKFNPQNWIEEQKTWMPRTDAHWSSWWTGLPCFTQSKPVFLLWSTMERLIVQWEKEQCVLSLNSRTQINLEYRLILSNPIAQQLKDKTTVLIFLKTNFNVLQWLRLCTYSLSNLKRQETIREITASLNSKGSNVSYTKWTTNLNSVIKQNLYRTLQLYTHTCTMCA